MKKLQYEKTVHITVTFVMGFTSGFLPQRTRIFSLLLAWHYYWGNIFKCTFFTKHGFSKLFRISLKCAHMDQNDNNFETFQVIAWCQKYIYIIVYISLTYAYVTRPWRANTFYGSFVVGLLLTHQGRDKMAAIFQTTLSNEFSWMLMYEFPLKNALKFVPRCPINNIPAWRHQTITWTNIELSFVGFRCIHLTAK